MLYIDNRLSKIKISGKGVGYVTNDFIPKNTIILREKPKFYVELNKNTISDVFEILYKILKSDNQISLSEFYNLPPKSRLNFDKYEANIFIELNKLKNTNFHYIYKFFINNFNIHQLTLFCAKYMCNAFEFGNGSAILFESAKFNHSCLPNVIFGKVKDEMWFITIKDIESGQEICDNYVDITQNIQNRQNRLLEQYNFQCKCDRCTCYDKHSIKYYDKKAKKINAKKTKFNSYVKKLNKSSH
ncbi:SET domain protein [Cotonvirus japonicus]|uniref:SET domain protein n=1 Tax=Cotonvirus japonicus TaxID=2811091 RepID=A0ABM7NRR7_9VIRU|nr:SET domain protein [Cotonvirus japonicus]BCS82854.1 SET domain protein [Cotonvirus japonicus]